MTVKYLFRLIWYELIINASTSNSRVAIIAMNDCIKNEWIRGTTTLIPALEMNIGLVH